MSFITTNGLAQLRRLDLLGRALTDEITASREESQVISESLAIHSTGAAEYARNAPVSADRAISRVRAIRASTSERTRRPRR
jgi:hypothetical protein